MEVEAGSRTCQLRVAFWRSLVDFQGAFSHPNALSTEVTALFAWLMPLT